MSKNTIELKILADVQQANDSLKSVSEKLNSLGKAAKSSGSESVALSSALAKVGHYGATIFGVSQIQSFTFALRDAQLSATRLANTLSYALGGESAGAAAMAYVANLANRLGLEFTATAEGFAKFSASARSANLSIGQTKTVFESVSKAVTVLGLSSADANGVFLAMSQMLSKGTVSAEELRGQMGERIPGAFDMAARAMGVTTKQLGKMLEKGQIVASDFLPKLAREMDKAFGAASNSAAQSAIANVNRLSNAWEQFKQKFGTAADAAGITAPHWLTRALNEANAAMDKSIAKGEKLQGLFASIGGFVFGAAGSGVMDPKNRSERVIKIYEEIDALEKRAKAISNNSKIDVADRGRVLFDLEQQISRLKSERETLWSMDTGKIKLPSKEELKQAVEDTKKSTKRSVAEEKKPPAWKEIWDENGSLLYKTRSESVEKFLSAQERDYRQLQDAIGKNVLDLIEEEEKWTAEQKAHEAKRWSDIIAQRQEYVAAAIDLDKDVAQQLGDVANSAYGNAWTAKFDGIATQLQQFVARFEAIKSTMSPEGADKMLFAINAWADASYKQAGVEGAQEEIGKIMEARQNRLAATQALVTAGTVSETQAQRDNLAANRDALAALEPLVNVLQALAESGYPPAIKAMEGFRSQLTDIQDQAKDKTWLDGINQGLKDVGGKFNDTFGDARKAVEKSFNAMTDALTDFVMTGKLSFGDFANSVIRDLVRIQIQESITKPLYQAMGSFNIAKMFGFAQGGAPGGVSAWKNQIVDKPTFFAFATGGVMGEAGPEAIMPLKRGPDGTLGVRGSGSNVTVNVINNASGAQATARERNEGGNRIIDVMIEQVKGAIAGDIARGAGPIPGALANTYGLNRVAGAY